ncbi:MAG: hypothetical protein LBF16_02620, partial [Pseudomonadales bacterium]|nr:hypothetical protein [Pseudomonadales bacterium]
ALLALNVSAGYAANAGDDASGFCELRVAAAQSDWDAEVPPSEGWTPMTLPDRWSARWPKFDGVVWYRITFDGACAQREPLGAWMDHLNMAGAVYLNGSLIERDTNLVEPLTRTWNLPRYWMLAAPLIHAGDNDLLVRVSGFASYQGGLGTVVIGAASAVRPLYDHARFMRRYVPVFGLATTGALSLLLFVVWLMRRSETLFGWYALQTFAWAQVLYNHITWSVWPLPSTDAWVAFTASAFLIFNAAFVVFTLRFSERQMPRLERTLWVFTVLQMIVIWVAPHAIMGEVRLALTLIPLSIFTIASIRFMVFSLRTRRIDHLTLALCLGLIILIGVYDMLQLTNVLITNTYYAALAVQIILIPASVLLAWRFVDSLKRIENFNKELTVKITAAQNELRGTLARQNEMEVDNARLGERLTLANDLHDSLGGTIIHHIITLENSPRDAASERFLATLRDLRDDLRNIIDTVSTNSSNPLPFSELIAPLRHRLMRAFEARGIDCQWQLTDLTGIRLLDARTSAGTMRVLQEGLTNVLRHSGATSAEVKVGVKDKALQLSIFDNGHGFDQSTPSSGLGLRSMRTRVSRLGGRFDVQSSKKGTALTIEIPNVVAQAG